MIQSFTTPTVRVDYDRERRTLVVVVAEVPPCMEWPEKTPRTLGEASEAIRDAFHSIFVEEYRREHRAAMEREVNR